MPNVHLVVQSAPNRLEVEMRVLNDFGNKFDLRAKVHNLRENWHWKAPKEKFQMLYNIPKTMFEWVGVRVFGDSQLDYYSHLGNVMVVYYVSMTLHTLYYWGKKDQFIYGTRCLCGMGIMISVNYLVFFIIEFCPTD